MSGKVGKLYSCNQLNWCEEYESLFKFEKLVPDELFVVLKATPIFDHSECLTLKILTAKGKLCTLVAFRESIKEEKE